MIGPRRLDLLLQGLLSLFQDLWLSAQPVLVLLLARNLGLDRLSACLPAATMAGSAAVMEGLGNLLLGKSFEPPLLLILAGVFVTCGGCGLAFLLDDLLLGLIAASTVYGVGVGLTRALTSYSSDDAIASKLHLNREIGGVLGGFVGSPILFVLQDTLGLKGAMLLIAAIGLLSVGVVLVQYREQWPQFQRPPPLEAVGHAGGNDYADDRGGENGNVREREDDTGPADVSADSTILVIPQQRHKPKYPQQQQQLQRPSRKPKTLGDSPPAPLFEKEIELERFDTSLPLAIDGKLPFAPQRRHQSQDLGYRQRVNSCADRELHSVSSHVLERAVPSRRRLNTEPAGADQNFNLVQKIIFAPERSVSVDVIHDNSTHMHVHHARPAAPASTAAAISPPLPLPTPLSPTTTTTPGSASFLRRSASQVLSMTILTPIEQPIATHIAIGQVLRMGAFSLLLFSFIANAHMFIISTTLLDAYVDKTAMPAGSSGAAIAAAAARTTTTTSVMLKATISAPASAGAAATATSVDLSASITAVYIFLVFALAKLVGILATDSLLRNCEASEKTLVLLTNFIGGFNLLASPFVHRLAVVAGWAAVIGLIEGALHFMQPNLIRIYLGARLEHTGRALAFIVCGLYTAVALPLFVHHYRDIEATDPRPPVHYDLLYQIFGLVQLGVSYSWLFLEPFFDKPLPEDNIGDDIDDIENNNDNDNDDGDGENYNAREVHGRLQLIGQTAAANNNNNNISINNNNSSDRGTPRHDAAL